jgi:transcriptional regulator with XRE-family HTH domain
MSQIMHMDGQTRKNFARRLRNLRELRYRTATEFAQLLGIEPQRYSKWEQGRAEPSLAWLLRVCQLLGCTPDFLLLGFTTPNNELPVARPDKPTQLKATKKQQKRNGTR